MFYVHKMASFIPELQVRLLTLTFIDVSRSQSQLFESKLNYQPQIEGRISGSDRLRRSLMLMRVNYEIAK